MKNARKLLIIAFWLLLWQAMALVIHNPILMVGPVETLCSLWTMLRTTMFWQSLAFSFVRIIAGFLIGSAVGILLAWGSYRRPFLEELLAPFILALKAVPVASFVIILLIWAGNRMLSLYISALVVLPLLYLNTLSGLKATDPKLLEMATVFHCRPRAASASSTFRRSSRTSTAPSRPRLAWPGKAASPLKSSASPSARWATASTTRRSTSKPASSSAGRSPSS